MANVPLNLIPEYEQSLADNMRRLEEWVKKKSEDDEDEAKRARRLRFLLMGS